ncbi:hypothetical protein OE88DRAFT_1657798 [Heliocybe sulcata]|uniref:Uncharacterized protein n=1 Tax=Heliocybe sulcata TaxID=5364 RepID=A0A5C3NG42_9AGAM|nr:hypothetical protein OE88DRAFT_1657798 [Heliocybe sulcata]
MFKFRTGEPFKGIPNIWDGQVHEEFNFIHRVLWRLFQSRGLEAPFRGLPSMNNTILATQERYNQPCFKCHHAGGRRWNSSNWSLLKGYWPPEVFFSMVLQGHLNSNPWEMNKLRLYLTDPTFTHDMVMSWTFDRTDDSGRYKNIRRDALLCTYCIADLLRPEFHIWWLEQKRTGA